MILAHLSDLHLRDEADAIGFASQLDRIVARRPDHLVITGDLLDRWQPALLERVLDLLGERNLLSAQALTILHGNHDLASSGGHPRERRDLWRLAVRFWDPPPVVAVRRRRFYRQIERRARGIAGRGPFVKSLGAGFGIAVMNTVPAPWRPFSIGGSELRLNHAIGAIDQRQTDWLSRLRREGTLVLLTHHYPLDVPPYRWHNRTRAPASASGMRAWLERWTVVVPMEIRASDRDRLWKAAAAAKVAAVLCGHVHRARLDRFEGVAVGLNGQSGAAWAGRTIAYYRFANGSVEAEYDSRQNR